MKPVTYKGYTENQLIREGKIIPDSLLNLCRENLHNKMEIKDRVITKREVLLIKKEKIEKELQKELFRQEDLI